MSDELSLQTQSPDETEALGERLSALVPIGGLVALYGELAAGKTCLVRGMARRYVENEIVASPTFTIVNQYGADPVMYHVDLYRLTGESELADLGYEELLEPADGVCVVEWADRAAKVLPETRLDVYLEHGGGDVRSIRFVNRGLLKENWRRSLTTTP